jgi:hypothetical protein
MKRWGKRAKGKGEKRIKPLKRRRQFPISLLPF